MKKLIAKKVCLDNTISNKQDIDLYNNAKNNVKNSNGGECHLNPEHVSKEFKKLKQDRFVSDGDADFWNDDVFDDTSNNNR